MFRCAFRWFVATALVGSAASAAAAPLAVAPAATGLVAQPDPCPPGGAVTLHGSGFLPLEVVAVALDLAPLALAQAGLTGDFTLDATIPAGTLPGFHALNATGKTSGWRTTSLFLVSTGAQQSGGDPGGSHSNPRENVLDLATTPLLRPAGSWSFGSAIDHAPLLHGTKAIVIHGRSRVSAIDRRRRSVAWTVDLGSSVTVAPAILPPHLVAAACADGRLRALDLRNGASRWSVAIGSPLFDLRMLHPATLKGFNPQPDPPCHLAAATATDLLVVSDDGAIETRLPLPQRPAVAPVSYGGPDTYGGPDSFGGSERKWLVASDTQLSQYSADGSVHEWDYPLPNAPTTLMALPYGIFVTSDDGWLRVIDFHGALLQSCLIGTLIGKAIGCAAGPDGSEAELDALFTFDRGWLARVTMGRGGPVVATFPLPAAPIGAPEVAGPVAWITLASQEAHAVDARTGGPLFTLGSPSTPSTQVRLTDGEMWVGTARGDLVRLK